MTDDPHIENRLAIAQVLQEHANVADGEDGSPGAAILIGYFVITEWADDNGSRWLSRGSSDASGRPLDSWRSNGYLHEALHEAWPEKE